jgi:glycosyltransferase involved in cell wall biosynthesis
VTYNQRHLIEECLDSILAQDHPDFEIAVADDGSKDGTAELLAAYDRAHPGKFVLRLADRNAGVTANHQQALEACRGEYISWFAGDDVMLPGKLTAQAAFLDANPDCMICYHDVELFQHETDRTIQLWSGFDRQRRGGVETLVRFGHFNTGISSMVRASRAPRRFEASIPVASDWLFYVECLAAGGTIAPIPGVFARQRRHEANVTGALGRSQPRPLLIEHLQSCALITGRYPKLAGAARYRAARLLLQQRWEKDGAHYRDFLRASLATRFSLPVATALAADTLFGWRR